MLTKKQITGHFGILEIIKEYPPSGQKQVFLVEHSEYDKVVIKFVAGENDRVRREIEIVTENNWINVPRILFVENYNIDGEYGICICEQYIDGKTLQEHLLSNGKMPLPDVLKLAEDILGTIVLMEECKVVHRDIKPTNIICNTNGEWYLIDFGIARVLNKNSLTLTEVNVGPHTPGYGAPELFQYRKKDIDSRADIFSLGVVLFEAATGMHPFVRGDEFDLNEIWYRTVTIIPESVIIDGDLDMQFISLIQTFMQKHITRRPKTAKQAFSWFTNVKNNVLGV